MAARWTAAGVSRLLAYYNSIESLKREGATNAALWNEVHAIEAEGGPITEGASIFDMNEVAARATAVIGAENAWQAGSEAGTIDGEMWAWAPWATQTTAAWGQPSYQIRYQYETLSPEGDIALSWGQTDWAGQLPELQSDILTRVAGSAQNSLDTYTPYALAAAGVLPGSTLGNITAVQLLRI